MEFTDGKVEVKFTFTESEINWIKEKFEIVDKGDIIDAVWEMISTYMELD